MPRSAADRSGATDWTNRNGPKLEPPERFVKPDNCEFLCWVCCPTSTGNFGGSFIAVFFCFLFFFCFFVPVLVCIFAGIFPTEIGRLSRLASLDCSHNSFRGKTQFAFLSVVATHPTHSHLPIHCRCARHHSIRIRQSRFSVQAHHGAQRLLRSVTTICSISNRVM